ncbi:MAG: NapC/NirT family cytochrome c [Chloroflexota bacterium]|nr:MAG: NapC/NirT family cytochrome c [Chloroflexota bacterium]
MSDQPTNPENGDQKRRRWLRWPRITLDLSQRKHRRNLLLVVVLVTVLSVGFLYANYRIYEYTESAEFCGNTCHVMDPQFVRYEDSAHAKVECAKCHIGPGASFFVKSKIDGISQVIAVLTDNYSSPITSPVHDLRPARETCETCHTPTSFKDNIIKTKRHYDSDEANTPVQSTLILKMGGWQEETGAANGIHWHINNPVYYIPADEQRQVILWVGAEQPDGTMKEYFSRDALGMGQRAFVEDAFENGEVREMDCIDCHNRTAHYVPSPQESVDRALEHGIISPDIPYIRDKALEVLNTQYETDAEAIAAIDGLGEFFQISGSGGLATVSDKSRSLSKESIDQSLETIKEIYDRTNFKELGLDWQTNPNNERHTPFPGCFRCHDGKHVQVDETGREVEEISVKCNLCHTVPIVGRGDEMLVEAPVITGPVPKSHEDFRWTVEHRSVNKEQEEACYVCHGQAFCSNAACHNLSHPPDMLFTHAEEYRLRGDEVCYTCHQNVLCSKCHPGGIVESP